MAVKNVTAGQQMADLVSGRRAELLALADVQIFQADVVDTNSRRRNVIIWRCGTDVFYASTMDALFDESRRKPAPQWLKDQVEKLPATRRFRANGETYEEVSSVGRPAPVLPAAVPLGDNESLDEDVAGARQA